MNDEVFIRPDWPAPATVQSLVTTRCGGVSRSPYGGFNLALHVGDDPDAVEANRRRLRRHLPAEPSWLEQVHGVVVADADSQGGVCERVPVADACLSREPGRVCVVMTADCLPVLLCDQAGTVVAAVHAGWRGLSAGVLEAAVARMEVAPHAVLAWLGPAIGPEAFEVGDEVRTRFVDADPNATAAFRPSARQGKWMADLFVLASLRLRGVGVERVFGGGVCTFADSMRFYSYRRDGVTGRFASLVWLDA